MKLDYPGGQNGTVAARVFIKKKKKKKTQLPPTCSNEKEEH
jgi:hypothetical protein